MKRTLLLIPLILLPACATNKPVVTHSRMARNLTNLALTPPMGWNSWNKFADKVNEELIRKRPMRWFPRA